MSRPKNFAKLVLDVEDTTQIDYNSWLQDMQERLSDLYGDVVNANAS